MGKAGEDDLLSLRHSEERLRLALEAGGMGAWDWQVAANVITWSPALGAIHELPDDTTSGTLDQYLATAHPDDREGVFAAIRAALEEDRDPRFEYRLILRDGRIRWVEGRGRLLRDDTGKPVRMTGVCWDVTERKRLSLRQDALAAAALKIPACLSMTRSLGATLQVVTDAAAEIIGAHVAVTSLTARRGQPMSATSLSERYAAWRGRASAPGDGRLAAQVCGANRPMRLTRAELERHPGHEEAAPDGPPLCGWLAVPLVGRDGANLGLLQLSDKEGGEFTAEDEAVAVQIAAMTAVAVENHALYEGLQASGRRKDEFLAMLSHELRNPLAPIRSAVQVLDAKGPLDPELERARDVIDRQVGQLTRLVDDLLDMARISRGKVVLRKEVVDLSTVVDCAIETVAPIIAERGHELTVARPAEPLRLEADAVRLQQVVGNLLANAAKYTESSGRIAISLEATDDDAVVRVRDTGIGMSPDFIHHAFDMFKQAEPDRKLSPGGLGLGLPLSRSIVRMHGGSISAVSPGLDLGTEFVVRLPRLRETPPESHAEPVPEPPPARSGSVSRRVLIVDDSQDSADLLAMLLRLAGHDVHTSYDGPSALEAAAEYAPDVVLLDIGLPGMDGHEVGRRIRELPGLAGVALVAVTGWAGEDDRRRSREAGFDHHLVKPLVGETVLEVVASARRE